MKFIHRIKKACILFFNAKHLRFPTLTRPMIGAASLPIVQEEHAYNFSDELLGRIALAFERSHADTPGKDMWAELHAMNEPFVTALKQKDFPALRAIFSTMFRGTLLYGMGHIELFVTKASPYDRNYIAYRCRDALMSLAEALALKGVPSNQQTALDDYVAANRQDLASYIPQIEKALGHSVSCPPVGFAPACQIGAHTVSPDSLRHAYVMHKLKTLGYQPNDSLLEIGGGFGNVARYAVMQGFRNYTIVDIPYVCAIQAAFLAATIGENNISLYGETGQAPVTIHPATYKNALQPAYDLVFNMDSLPEINAVEASEYVGLIKSRAKSFLSINQEAAKAHIEGEAQHRVSQLADEAGFKRLYRYPYWMEQGYTEELYRVA